MNLLKKSLSVLAVAAMAVSLAGCGGSSSSSKSTESGEKVFRFGQSNPKVGLDMQRFYMIFQNISNMRKLYFTLCTQSHICDFIHRVFPFVIFIGGTRHGCRKSKMV